MRIEQDHFWEYYLPLLCLFKVYKDAGNAFWEYEYRNVVINDYDYYFQYALDAMEYAAPIVETNEHLYHKHGYESDYDEVNIYAFSSEEMQKCFRLARKIDRLEEKCGKNNSMEKYLCNEMESIRGFQSYCFDYFIGNKRKGARLEVLFFYEFDCYIAMNLWIVRVMQMFKKELPILRKRYRQAKRANKQKKGEKCDEVKR